jgi:hypothetical protein
MVRQRRTEAKKGMTRENRELSQACFALGYSSDRPGGWMLQGFFR